MYASLWRRLPGPSWARVVMLALAAAIVVLCLLEWGFPWLSHTLPFQEQTVGE